MGYMRHHAIIVTSWQAESLNQARDEAISVFGHSPVSDVIASDRNDYVSFFVAPDGSKEGWERSDEGDEARDLYVSWLHRQAHDDGSSLLDWAEVQYGDEEGHNRVTRHDYEARTKVR